MSITAMPADLQGNICPLEDCHSEIMCCQLKLIIAAITPNLIIGLVEAEHTDCSLEYVCCSTEAGGECLMCTTGGISS